MVGHMIYKGIMGLHFISSNVFCYSFYHTNCPPFPMKSCIGLSNFCNSGQNILRKLTIPEKLLQPFGVVGGHNFCMALNLLLNSLMQTFLSFMNIMFPMYSISDLNNYHFFGSILRPFLSKAFNKFSNLDICTLFEGVNDNKSSIIVPQCFLLCKHSKIAFIYDHQIEGDIFNPIDILWYMYEALP